MNNKKLSLTGKKVTIGQGVSIAAIPIIVYLTWPSVCPVFSWVLPTPFHYPMQFVGFFSYASLLCIPAYFVVLVVDLMVFMAMRFVVGIKS